MQSGGYTMVFREVYNRIASLYAEQDVKDVFTTIDAIEFDDDNVIISYHQDGDTVWNTIFSVIKEKKGMLWLSVLEPFVQTLCGIYDLELPDVFKNSFNDIISENKRLLEVNQALDQTVKSANDRLVKCQITGLYNGTFFQSLLVEELENEDWRDLGALVCINIDDFADYTIQYGNQEERNVLNNMAYLLKEEFGGNSVYRLDYSDFTLYLKKLTKKEVIAKVERFRVKMSKSDLFVGDLTISAGIAFSDEIELDASTYEVTISQYQNLALERLRSAVLSDKNSVCFEGENNSIVSSKGKVLVVDTDLTNVLLIKAFLAEDGIEVITADNGLDAAELAINHLPKVIISEIMLNKLDGFGFRERILNHSTTKNLEFIFLSHKKDGESVERAIELGVTHFIHKPYLLTELLGIVKKKLRD